MAEVFKRDDNPEDEPFVIGGDPKDNGISEDTQTEANETIDLDSANEAAATDVTDAAEVLETEENPDVSGTLEQTADETSDEENIEQYDTYSDEENLGYYDEDAENVPEEPKKGNAKIVIIVIAAVIVLLAALAGLAYRFGGGYILVNHPEYDHFFYNKYNHMGYVDVYGQTIADLVEENNSYVENEEDKTTVAEFKEMYNLPADMRGDTALSIAEYMLPVTTYFEMVGVTYDDIKEYYGLGDEVNENMTWGEFSGEITVKNSVGEENVEDFKEQYGFGDEVTGDTKWKEVRNVVDEVTRQEYEEYQRMMEEMMSQTEESLATEAPADGTATEAPADGTATEVPADAAAAATDVPAAAEVTPAPAQ